MAARNLSTLCCLSPCHLPEQAALKLQGDLRQVIDKYAEASELLLYRRP